MVVERHYGYPKWYKTSNEKGRNKPLRNSAKFASLDSLAKLARETSLDGLDWGLAVLVAAEHAVEPGCLVHVGFGGSGGVLLQAADGGKSLAEMLGIVGGLCDLRLVCIRLYCWLYDGDELAARDELWGRGGRRGCQGAGKAPHSPGGVGTDLLELLAGTADLFWIRLRGMLRAGLERAVLRLVAISKELRCVRLLQGRVSNRDSAHIRPAVLLTSSSARPPRHDEQMPMECGCVVGVVISRIADDAGEARAMRMVIGIWQKYMRARPQETCRSAQMDGGEAGGRSAGNERDCPVTICAKSPPGLAWK